MRCEDFMSLDFHHFGRARLSESLVLFRLSYFVIRARVDANRPPLSIPSLQLNLLFPELFDHGLIPASASLLIWGAAWAEIYGQSLRINTVLNQRHTYRKGIAIQAGILFLVSLDQSWCEGVGSSRED